jgi:hypothetical protein
MFARLQPNATIIAEVNSPTARNARISDGDADGGLLFTLVIILGVGVLTATEVGSKTESVGKDVCGCPKLGARLSLNVVMLEARHSS